MEDTETIDPDASLKSQQKEPPKNRRKKRPKSPSLAQKAAQKPNPSPTIKKNPSKAPSRMGIASKNGIVASKSERRKRRHSSLHGNAADKNDERLSEASDDGELEIPRKKYLVSGIYADLDTFSVADVSVIPRGKGKGKEVALHSRKRLTRRKWKWPKPLYFGEFVFNKKEDFCLPYDIWWRSKHGKFEKESSSVSIIKQQEYKLIKNSVYVDVKQTMSAEPSVCDCKLPGREGEMGCKDDCLNRMVYTECSLKHCPCGVRCSNQQFQKHQWTPGLKKIMTRDRGYGMIAMTDLKAGQFIIEYVGEVISEQLYRERVATQYKHQRCHYCLSVEGGIIIDAHNMGSRARFVNHSCDPNCEMQKWFVNGTYRMGLFALKDIPSKMELNYDYNFDAMDNDLQKCFCMSENCRRVIGAKSGNAQKGLRSFSFVNMKRKVKRKLGDLKGDGIWDKLRAEAKASPVSNGSGFELPLYKPMSLRERAIVSRKRLFLCRNLLRTVENFSLVLEVLRDQESKSDSLKVENGSFDGGPIERDAAFIRCICGIPVEEGLMIQCDKCHVWQHCDCMNYYPPENAEDVAYFCEKCSYREVDMNIPLKPQPVNGTPGCTYYLTFWHNGQLIKKEGCAYTSRHHSMSWKNGKVRSCNRRLRLNHEDQLDVFRITALWQTDKFERFAYGFHYFRPKEVSRVEGQLFYPNEVFQTKLFEVVPLEAVIAPCIVTSRNSYVQGRPLGFEEKDVYVCAMSYCLKEQKTKMLKKKQFLYPVCKDASVFCKFPQPASLQRTVPADPSDATSHKKSERLSKGSQKPKQKTSQGKSGVQHRPELPSPGAVINSIAEELSGGEHIKPGEKVDVSVLLH
eukprot:m.289059 g.289059  ORF g.289059 m.289059 type:complete len:853 (+) comp40711_c0_seq5:7812-10370(+)